MSAVVAYEDKLTADPRFMLSEISMQFDKSGPVYRTLDKVSRRLDALNLPYVAVGGMALSLHGFIRATDDVDLLVTADTLAAVHQRLEGLGWVTPFAGSKNLRDADTGVKIEFLVTGGYPGDGKPKPVSFPDPADVAVEIGGIKCINLPTLVQLKLASGTVAWRLKDLADVQEVIRILALPRTFAESVDPWVRDKFLELWDAVHSAPPGLE